MFLLGPSSATLREAVCYYPGVWACYDFEDGTLGPWQGGNWSVASVDGTYVLDMFYPAVPNQSSGLYENGGSGHYEIYYSGAQSRSGVNELHMRWYEKLTANWIHSAISEAGWRLMPHGGSSADTWDINLTTDMYQTALRPTVLLETPWGRKETQLWPNRGPEFKWLGTNLGRWIQVEVHIKLNTPGQSDGVFEQWLDGILISRHLNLNIRGLSTQGIESFALSGYWNCWNSTEQTDNCRINDISHPDMHRYIDRIVIADGDVMIGPLGALPSGTTSAPSSTLVSKASGEAICSNPAVWACFDFEDGTLGPWKGGNWSVTSQEKYAGAYALDMLYPALPNLSRGHYDNGGSGYYEIYYRGKHSKTGIDEFHMRWYEKLSANWVHSIIAEKGWQLRPFGGTPADTWDIYLLNDMYHSARRPTVLEQTPWRNEIQLWSNLGPRFLWLESNLGRWVQIEIHIRLNTPGISDGLFEQWLDGILVTRATNLNIRGTSTQGVDMFMLSGYWNCWNSAKGINDCLINDIPHPDMHRYIDNIVMADGDFMIGSAQ